MGNYNPRAPYILGQELVPIQDLDLVFSPTANSVEYGTAFKLQSATQLGTAKFYTQGPTPRNTSRQCVMVNVYPVANVGAGGPIEQVIIPCTSVAVTGNTIVSSATSATDALYNPTDGGLIQFSYNGLNQQFLTASFNTSSYPFLSGKRILNVSLVYVGNMNDVVEQDGVGVEVEFENPNKNWQSMTLIEQIDDGSRSTQFFADTSRSNTGSLDLATKINNTVFSPGASTEFKYLNLGDVNNFWNPGVDPNIIPQTPLSWNYTDLLKFEDSALTAVRQKIKMSLILPETAGTDFNNQIPRVFLRYLALRVTYCNETRVATGSKSFIYRIGSNFVSMYDLSHQSNPVLLPGEYIATLSVVDPGATDFGQNITGIFPDLNATRELYTIPSHPSLQLNVPYPLDETSVGKSITAVESHLLPQVSLHASGGAALLEPQVYGRQAIGQVYGSFTVTQEVHDSLAGSVGTWPWIRFYARRHGTTTVPLSVAVAGGSAYITPEEFDDLEQITTENWREVTLELSPAPSMGGGSIPQIVWSATGEQAGNRWEVLGAAAPAVSGLAGSLVTQVPTAQRLGPATYGQPVSGSVINMAWLPQLGPYVTGTTDDESADVSFLLSQSPPAVTGITATWLSQAVTGIGQTCGIDPCCIPSEIYYLQLAWNQPAEEELLLDDSFDRTESGVWGTPDTGPPWDDVFTGGGTPSVAGGLGIHTMTTDNGYVTEQAGSLSITNSRLLATSVQPSATPVGGFVRATLFGRETGSFTYSINVDVDFLADGTAEVSISELGGSASEGPVAIPGVTASDAVDVMVDLIGNNVLVRVALSSEGVGPGTPPILWATVTSASAGHIGVETHTETGVTVPIDMQYGHITIYEMAATASVPVSFKDTFDRDETGTWGAPYYGPEYVALNSSAALSVVNNEGLIEHTTMGADPEGAVIPLATANFDITAMLRNESGGTIRAGVMGRYIVDNFYEAYVEVSSATVIDLVLSKTVAGISTELARFNITSISGITTGIGSATMIRFMANESNLKVKVWAPTSTEPLMWLIEDTDSDITTDVGYMAFFIETLSASSATLAVSNVEITPPQYWFGSYDLQRRDTVDDEWQTIMKATNPAVTTFNDFEARPGIVSEYRIRTSNVYDFHGEWSPAVSGMIPAPGIYGGCVSNGHILIFTTNEHQSGTSNLAYASVWLDQQVDENFSFPEAGFVQMQAMYDRDFYVAFRPLERGGEQFQRTVLVQAAAIAPETLADFTNLRNLAWSDVNYVCVRDEDGNRWFAHIGVPSGNVLRNRKLYLAPVQVTEVSATPTPVDPSPWL